jgi:hypothetical protein
LDAVRRLQPGKIVRSRLSGDSPIVLGIALVFVGKVITMKGSLKPRIEGVRFISSWGHRRAAISLGSADFRFEGFNVVGAGSVLPIFAGAWPVLVADWESRSSSPKGSSVMYLGRAHKRFAPSSIHRVHSQVLVSMALMRPYGCRLGTSNVLCLSVAVNVSRIITDILHLHISLGLPDFDHSSQAVSTRCQRRSRSQSLPR